MRLRATWRRIQGWRRGSRFERAGSLGRAIQPRLGVETLEGPGASCPTREDRCAGERGGSHPRERLVAERAVMWNSSAISSTAAGCSQGYARAASHAVLAGSRTAASLVRRTRRRYVDAGLRPLRPMTTIACGPSTTTGASFRLVVRKATSRPPRARLRLRHGTSRPSPSRRPRRSGGRPGAGVLRVPSRRSSFGWPEGGGAEQLPFRDAWFERAVSGSSATSSTARPLCRVAAGTRPGRPADLVTFDPAHRSSGSTAPPTEDRPCPTAAARGTASHRDFAPDCDSQHASIIAQRLERIEQRQSRRSISWTRTK